MRDDRIAVIGTALRFPGADTPEAYWRDIRAGRSRVRRFTRAEFAAAGVPAAEYERPGFGGASAPLEGVDGFDAGFFGMSGREAELTDPQQRLFLECCFHALEDGGYAGGDDRYAGLDGGSVRIGVYGSSGYRLYSLHSYLAHHLAAEAGSGDWMTAKQVQVGNYTDFTATRAAFRLGLTGPALTVSTACSSALVSVHLACQALRAGDADLMLVGSAALHLPQVSGHVPVKGSTVSPTGAVRAFDADADGTVGGNGAAAVLLKPLERALADGDTVHAVILGSAVTNDGADKRGFAAPGVAGQRDAVLGALRAADVDAATIGYVEAHGTGTLKGDPIEFAALTEAFRAHTDRTGFCALGSTKPAIGHLDSAAGLAGLIKAVEVLRHGIVPPLVNFARPNPALAVDDSPFLLPVRERAWPLAGVRRAGVHSIGMGGTNAHVILEQAPEALPVRPAPPAAPVPALLPLSAADGDALRAYATALRDHLAGGARPSPADLLTTTALGRRLLPHRLVVTAADPVAGLEAFLSGVPAGEAYTTGVADGVRDPAPVFLFSGQGGGHPGMGAELAARFPVAAEVLEACARVYAEETGRDDFLDRIVGGQGPARWDTAFAQPALFALQLAQARLWERLGVTPARVAGHSVGAYAALCVAGALDTEDAMRLVCGRGRLMQERSAPGAMVSVFVPRARVRELLAAVPGLELAVVNGATHQVLGGSPEAVDTVRELLAARGEAYEVLAVDRAFHTALLDPALEEFRVLADKTEPRPLHTEFIDGIDGTVRPAGWRPDAAYLVAQARRTADFSAVMAKLGPAPLLLELGPSAVLTGLVRRASPGAVCLPTRDWERAVAALHCAGAGVDWAALLDGCGGRRVRLPTYPFQRRSHWRGPAPYVHPSPRSTEDRMTEQAVLDRVLELTARHLGHRSDEVSADRTFVGLGADSLQLIGMVRQLEAEFGTEISMREILEEAGTPRLTAALIAGRTAPSVAAPPSAAPLAASATLTAPVAARPAPLTTPAAAGVAAPVADEPVYATRAEVTALSEQIRQLAETQAAMLTQLSEAVALLTARTTGTDAR
ncbi:acyltransferase domain-containing protein [Streptomyces sp. MBT56]|uniref:type I polyketide synthase n=2 Tax=Streptomyces TaxID=1883 RepID=UPI00190C8661|nr:MULTISPECIES: type I polyketide synthase [unclassified Streptomyces]MBK3557912.1 acyltransferase domain-containing protein [Streptomyces sp. MBT56]MBK3616365.1 acyltransferase domain-containing protein [Streptomyces sp. MBT98]MBK6045566.1 acyltransferase domain-containing protein [Streptomyces sp. MBT55]